MIPVDAACVYEAVRSPFGRHGGAPAKTRPDHLAAHAPRAPLGRAPRVTCADIDVVGPDEAPASPAIARRACRPGVGARQADIGSGRGQAMVLEARG